LILQKSVYRKQRTRAFKGKNQSESKRQNFPESEEEKTELVQKSPWKKAKGSPKFSQIAR
jgi:hypothetical protein